MIATDSTAHDNSSEQTPALSDHARPMSRPPHSTPEASLIVKTSSRPTPQGTGVSPGDFNVLIHDTKDKDAFVYGPASSFRAPNLASPSNSAFSARDTETQKHIDVARMRTELIAWSTLQRQKEILNVSSTADVFDGIDGSSAIYLLDLYWNHQYNTFLALYRPAIMSSITSNGPWANKLLQNALFFTGALQSGDSAWMSDPNDSSTLGQRFLHRFQELLASEIEESSIASACALLVMSSSLLTRGRTSLAWLYAGLAFRMVVGLGLDLDPTKIDKGQSIQPDSVTTQPAVVDELQRRLFWGAYLHDRLQSVYYGRRPCLNVPYGFEPSSDLLDTYEEYDAWNPSRDMPGSNQNMSCRPQPKYSVSNRKALLAVAMILSDIIEAFYCPTVIPWTQETACDAVAALQRRLTDWADGLPVHLKYDPNCDPVPPPHRLYTQ
jgi:hypothetical protein